MNGRNREAWPELYPDLVAAGSLTDAMAREAARLGHRFDALAAVEGFDTVVAACCIRGEARFGVYATNVDEREFRFEISTDSGWPWGAFGSTPGLGVVTAILHAWRGGASIDQLRLDWPLLAPTPLAAALPGRVVSTAWRLTLERSPVIRLGDAELAEALYAEPALRVFFPFPSHGDFSLLSSTAAPFREEVPRVKPAGQNLWNVVTPWSPEIPSKTLGTRLTAREAAALVAACIPAGSGPAIEGGWPTDTSA